jgi:hypothetical protein
MSAYGGSSFPPDMCGIRTACACRGCRSRSSSPPVSDARDDGDRRSRQIHERHDARRRTPRHPADRQPGHRPCA